MKQKVMSAYADEYYRKDKIRAIDAKFEARKLAYAPLFFQAIMALLELGVLKDISDSGEKGLTIDETAKKANISTYGAQVLLEMALGINIVKVLENNEEDRFVLGKIGYFLLEDEMTRVNFDFVNDVCYKGAFELKRSVQTGKPLGLETFGYEGKKIYEVLSVLPEKVKKSWFAFDHFFSDIAFEDALPIVFSGNPKKIIDIGGNTAKWAIACCRYDPNVEVLIVDLPGQTKVAEQEVKKAGFSGRVNTFVCNILDEKTAIPPGADVIWMSQFLDCFSIEEIISIMEKVRSAAGSATDVYILEPFCDKQRYQVGSFSLQAISLYFTCMANGNSKMYNSGEFTRTIENAGFDIVEAWHNVGSNDYSLLRCRRRP